jgi:hypothetical protein
MEPSSKATGRKRERSAPDQRCGLDAVERGARMSSRVAMEDGCSRIGASAGRIHTPNRRTDTTIRVMTGCRKVSTRRRGSTTEGRCRGHPRRFRRPPRRRRAAAAGWRVRIGGRPRHIAGNRTGPTGETRVRSLWRPAPPRRISGNSRGANSRSARQYTCRLNGTTARSGYQ